MSVKLGLMALLADGERYGAQLRAEFEARTGGTWPLNIGLVYTTLTRLERDGLVAVAGAADEEGRIRYRLTDSGRAEVARWWTEPVDRAEAPRDELVIKLALAVTVAGVDVASVVQSQRTATMRHLRDLTRLKVGAASPGPATDPATSDARDLAWALVLENHIFAAEAEVRWLDHVEARLARAAASSAPVRAAQPTAEDEALGGIPEGATGSASPARVTR